MGSIVWAAFDMPMTGVPLKDALGYKKIVFWAFKKIIMDIHLTTTCVIISKFTLDGGFQLFCADFDMTMTGVPLEVALGWQKFYFWAFQKNNHASECQVSFFLLFL